MKLMIIMFSILPSLVYAGNTSSVWLKGSAYSYGALPSAGIQSTLNAVSTDSWGTTINNIRKPLPYWLDMMESKSDPSPRINFGQWMITDGIASDTSADVDKDTLYNTDSVPNLLEDLLKEYGFEVEDIELIDIQSSQINYIYNDSLRMPSSKPTNIYSSIALANQ